MANHTTFITDSNKTPAIQIVVWVLLGSAIIGVLLRAYTKLAIVRFLGADDFMVPAALLFLAAQSAAVTIQTLNGLGKPLKEMSPEQLETNYLFQWIAMLLYIPSLCFSKLATLFLLHLISSIKIFQQLFAATGILIIGWALSAEFAAAFQCKLPHPWRVPEDQCINRLVFWTYFESMNAATDILLMFLPLGVAWNVKTSAKRKAWVLIVFFARGLGAAVALVKILLFRPAFVRPEPSLGSWPFVLCTQLIQFLSLMSACILYLRPFIEALTSGFINGDDLRRRGQMTPFVVSTGPAVVAGALGALPLREDEKEEANDSSGSSQPNPTPQPILQRNATNTKRQPAPPPLRRDNSHPSDWPLPADPLAFDDEDEVGIAREVVTPSEAVTGISRVVPAPVTTGSETRRFRLEQTKAGSVYAPSIASRHLVGPLRMPAFPRSAIPLGANNLPRVSQIYSPLAEEGGIRSYIAASSSSGAGSSPSSRKHSDQDETERVSP